MLVLVISVRGYLKKRESYKKERFNTGKVQFGLCARKFCCVPVLFHRPLVCVLKQAYWNRKIVSSAPSLLQWTHNMHTVMHSLYTHDWGLFVLLIPSLVFSCIRLKCDEAAEEQAVVSEENFLQLSCFISQGEQLLPCLYSCWERSKKKKEKKKHLWLIELRQTSFRSRSTLPYRTARILVRKFNNFEKSS